MDVTSGTCDVPQRVGQTATFAADGRLMTTTMSGSTLEDRLRAVSAHGRVADALLGVALDVIEPYASDYLSADEYSHLCDALRKRVDGAADAALSALVDSLAPALKTEDPALMARLEAVRRRSL